MNRPPAFRKPNLPFFSASSPIFRPHGVSILYISHRLPEVFSLCDTMTVLRDGRHVRTVPTTATTEAEAVRFMVGRELLAFQRHPVEPKGDVVLRVNNLSQKGQYENVSFEVRSGEIVAMAGLIGAGRSETALGIFGSPPPDRGEVFLRGGKVNFREPKDAVTSGNRLCAGRSENRWGWS